MPRNTNVNETRQSILILNRTFPPLFGATGRMACDLALYLRKLGYHITVVTTAPQGKIDTAKQLKVVRVGTNANPKTIRDYLKILKQMRQAALNEDDHDIIISMTDPPLLAIEGHKIAKKMNAKHIHWAMDIYPDLLPVMGKSPSKWAYRWAQKKMHRALRKANAVVPISKCMARYLTHQSLPRQNMHIIENWPDKYLLDFDEAEIEPLFEENKFRILYAGTIGLAHEFDAVLRAAHYLQTRYPDIEFIFTKQGKGARPFEARKRSMGLDNIRMIQPQPGKKLTALMATGDMHLITMKNDALGKLFPSKFYAAMTAGRPVVFVGPEACDLHHKTTQNNLGASIRTDDPQELVQAILKYFKNSDDWFTASENASLYSARHDPMPTWKDLIQSL